MTMTFLGRGVSFPLRLDVTGTKPAFSSEADRVFESIEVILNTSIGERPHRIKRGVPFGTRFQSLLFSNVAAAIDIAYFDAKQALDVWEPRIIVTNISIDKVRKPESGLFGILITIMFIYRTNNRPDNYVNFFRSQPFEEG